LLDMLSIEGAFVIIDAIGCQRKIARKIIDKKFLSCPRVDVACCLLARPRAQRAELVVSLS